MENILNQSQLEKLALLNSVYSKMEKKGFWNYLLAPLALGVGTALAPVAFNKTIDAVSNFTGKSYSENAIPGLTGLKNTLQGVAGSPTAILGGMANSLGFSPETQEKIKKYAPSILGITALTALMSGNKKKKQQQGTGAQPLNININTGNANKPGLLSQDPSYVGSFSKYGYYLSKKADIITDSLINAAKNRVANKLIDKAINQKNKKDNTSEEKEKNPKVELLSKNPSIKKLLENKENKEYLEKLISEKS